MTPERTKVEDAQYAVLNTFWAADDSIDRLDLLTSFAQIVVPRPSDWDVAAIRAESERIFATLTASRCFICRHSDRPFIWHHIIQVQNGGSNDSRNRVELCELCHTRVHPWMTYKPTGGWQRIGEIGADRYPRRRPTGAL